MTQPRDVVHASKLFQEWLTALKERALLQTHNQSQAMFRGVPLGLRRHMTTEGRRRDRGRPSSSIRIFGGLHFCDGASCEAACGLAAR